MHQPTTKKISSAFTALTVLALLVLASPARANISEDQVRSAWHEVTRIAEMTELPLDIKDDKVPNAWVTAGQSVTVTTGLMKLLVREEEMFGVLMHEAGHAKLGHYEGRVKNSTGIGIAALLLSRALDSSLGDIAVNLGANLATAGYSREQEVEADDFAVDLAFKGEIAPTGLYTALERLANAGGATQPSGFNSHPPDERRLQHIKARILKGDPNAIFPDVTTPSPEETAAAEETQLGLNVILVETGANGPAVLNIVREATGMSLKDALAVVDHTPKLVKECATAKEAQELQKKLEEAGAKTERR